MKVVILAGGQGSRLSEYTKIIPKPMVKISGVPIISRIIKHYKKYGFKEYLIASGYKSKKIGGSVGTKFDLGLLHFEVAALRKLERSKTFQSHSLPPEPVFHFRKDLMKCLLQPALGH